jgi:hypothetical protein
MGSYRLFNDIYVNKNAFKDIEDKDKSKRGNGIFDFSDFRIHI